MATTTLPERTREVLERLNEGKGASDIANELGITRNAVYQHITKLRKEGYLPERTPTRAQSAAPAELSIEQTVSQFHDSLRRRITWIDERKRTLADEDAKLTDERKQIEHMLTKLT